MPERPFRQEFTWPSTPRSLHGEGSHWRLTASLDWARGNWYTRIMGFRTAAELLGAYVAEHRNEQDVLIFPFLYNWRQHIELALKQLIIETEKLLDVSKPVPTGHRLEALWARLRSLLEESGHGSTEELDNVSSAIAELHAMDPSGDAFRYPLSLEGKPTLAAVNRLSFDLVTAALVPVSDFLEAVDTAISVALDTKGDLERQLA